MMRHEFEFHQLEEAPSNDQRLSLSLHILYRRKMDISQNLARSRSTERLNILALAICVPTPSDPSIPLIRVESSEKIMVEPVWELEGDFKGRMYADYIIDHSEHNWCIR
jgi:hypothetical protein